MQKWQAKAKENLLKPVHIVGKGKAAAGTLASAPKRASRVEDIIVLPPPSSVVTPATPTKPSSSQLESSARATPPSFPNYRVLPISEEASI